MNISIVIPVYNEATQIKELLFYLNKKASASKKIEIIVVDGKSTDATYNHTLEFDFVKVFKSKKGRGKQMNYGAKQASFPVLYFLHADSRPPKNFDVLIANKINNGEKAGCFFMKFTSNHPWLKLAGWFTKFNIKFFRGGDQSLFIDKDYFFQLGGFNESMPIFEDYDFIRRLYKNKTFSVIQKPIITSARRYKENGIAKLQFHYWALYFKKWLGASAEDLFGYYKKHIK